MTTLPIANFQLPIGERRLVLMFPRSLESEVSNRKLGNWKWA